MLTIDAIWIVLIFLILWYALVASNHKMMNIIRRKRKGEKRKMPTEMIKEFIGKDCVISLFNEAMAVQGKIITLEDNWIKVEEKKRIRIINGDMIRDIAMSK